MFKKGKAGENKCKRVQKTYYNIIIRAILYIRPTVKRITSLGGSLAYSYGIRYENYIFFYRYNLHFILNVSTDINVNTCTYTSSRYLPSYVIRYLKNLNWLTRDVEPKSDRYNNIGGQTWFSQNRFYPKV